MWPGLKKLSRAMLLSLLVSFKAGATQVIENADQDHQQANMSAGEQNRLAVEGRRSAHVVPSQKGVISVVKDEALGALYFTLAEDLPNPGTVTLFVSDDQGVTYKLILVPQPITGEEIILRPPIEQTPFASGQARHSDGCAMSYQRRIKDLMLVMADDELKDAVETIVANKTVPLWEEGHLVLLTQYLAGELAGEQYRLTNTSPSDLLLAEQALYRRGVYAVAVERHTLAVGDATDIFIVCERKDDE